MKLRSLVPSIRLPGSQKNSRRAKSAQPPTPQQELLRKEMMAAGDRLNLALQVENDLYKVLVKDPKDELVGQWKECRRSVELFAEDYASAVTAYRKAVTAWIDSVESANTGTGRQSSSSCIKAQE